MTHRIRRVAGLAALATLVAVPALAADPVADSRYAGHTSQGRDFRLEFRVSEDGTKVDRLLAQWRAPVCENAQNGAQGSVRPRDIAIIDGVFNRRGKEFAKLEPSGGFAGGSQVERYRISGRFVTSELAKGTLKITVKVRNKAGVTIDTCTTRKTITWSADRLGVVPETVG